MARTVQGTVAVLREAAAQYRREDCGSRLRSVSQSDVETNSRTNRVRREVHIQVRQRKRIQSHIFDRSFGRRASGREAAQRQVFLELHIELEHFAWSFSSVGHFRLDRTRADRRKPISELDMRRRQVTVTPIPKLLPFAQFELEVAHIGRRTRQLYVQEAIEELLRHADGVLSSAKHTLRDQR